jgi:hypothetical protein
MQDIRRWFLWTLIIGPLHMGEQLLTNIAELHELKGFFAKYYTLFRDPDYGTVVLVTIGFTLVNLIVYGLLAGGRLRLLAVGFFALVAIGEIHHIAKTVVNFAYFPGAVTAIPFFLFGLLLLRAVVREWRATATAGKFAAAA